MKQEQIRDRLVSAFGPDVVKAVTEFRGEVSVTVDSNKLLDVCRYLKSDPDLSFDFLSFVGGVDRYPQTPRFEIVYQLYSLDRIHRFRIKILADEAEGQPAQVESVVGIWPTADWHERETAEMYGITFKNHPDPRKLLLPDDWTVHPLRKDFPLQGSDQDTPDLPPSK
jgi:NADH-quinone oxidoreductase subunit C